MFDGSKQLAATTRTVGDRTEEHRTSVISQVYATDIEDLWDAVTNPERIPRWFAPVSGELKEGGAYQIEGNAGGTISRCDRPQGYDATWEFNGGVSWIEVRLTPVDAEHTKFQLEHYGPVPEEFWDQFGPTATGVGWDLSLLGLATHVADPDTRVDPEAAMAWTMTDEGRAFLRGSAEAWIAAYVAAGGDPEKGSAMATAAYKFYSGDNTPEEYAEIAEKRDTH